MVVVARAHHLPPLQRGLGTLWYAYTLFIRVFVLKEVFCSFLPSFLHQRKVEEDGMFSRGQGGAFVSGGFLESQTGIFYIMKLCITHRHMSGTL